jgi:hypothetical protein
VIRSAAGIAPLRRALIQLARSVKGIKAVNRYGSDAVWRMRRKGQEISWQRPISDR